MKNSRKKLWNILNDNIINLFNLVIVFIIVLLFVRQSFIYIIPFICYLVVSFLNFYLDYQSYLKIKTNKSNVHVLVDGQQIEKPFNKLVKDDEVYVYPNDCVEFVGKVKEGIAFVNEGKIDGKTKPVRKTIGDNIKIGSYIISGTAVLQVVDLYGQQSKGLIYQKTAISSYLKWINIGLSALTFVFVLISLINSSNSFLSLDNNLQACLLSLPGILNILISVFLTIESRNLKSKQIDVLDNTALTELDSADIICLEKTGILTSGQYEVFKTVPIVSASFSSNPDYVNTTFAQVISDVIKTNNESGGWFNALNESFQYDVAKVVIDSCSLKDNGLYSVATFKGGKTHAIGVPENFEFTNQESVYNFINQYRFMGYRVLVLVESKNPLKAGLIDGKCMGIGIVVLQEKIRESIRDFIKKLQEKGKIIKVISGDEKECVSDVCRKAGIDVANKTMSLNGMTFEQLEMVIDNQNVFTDASSSQKEFIVNKLKESGHKVLFIGDCDIDSAAMKKSNMAMSLNSSSQAANKCSQIVLDQSFTDFESLYKIGNKQKMCLTTIMTLFYSQAISAAILSLLFSVANLFDVSLVNPFTFSHLLTWFIFGSLLPGLVVLFGKVAPNKKIHFKTSLVASSLAYIIPIIFIYLFQIIEANGGGYFNIPSDLNNLHEPIASSLVANNLSCLALLLISLFVLFRQLSPFNNRRIVTFMALVLVPAIYFVLLGFNIDGISIVTGIDTSILTIGNYFVGALVAFVGGSLYLMILNIFDIIKGENYDVKN